MPGDLPAGIRDQDPVRFARDVFHRVFAAFFLGWVFVFSSQHLFAQARIALSRRLDRARQQSNVHNHDMPNPVLSEKLAGFDLASPQSVDCEHREHSHLTSALALSFAMAALTQAISLGYFDVSGGSAACAFVVAWGSMSAQSAHVIGLLILSFDLAAHDVKRWQLLVLWTWLAVTIVLVFVSSATNIGTLVELRFAPDRAICFRKHFLPTTIPLSIANIVLSAACAVKFLLLASPDFLRGAGRSKGLLDIHVLRALSLLLLDLLTVVPTATFVSISADFVPFSVGSVFVLAAFTHVSPRSPTLASVSPEPLQQPSIHLNVPNRQSSLSFGSLVQPPVSRLHRSLPPIPRHSGHSDSLGPVLHIRDQNRTGSSGTTSEPPSAGGAVPRGGHDAVSVAEPSPLSPSDIRSPIVQSPQALRVTVPRWRGSVNSPLEDESTMISRAEVRLAYREPFYASRTQDSAPNTPHATARTAPSAQQRLPSSIIAFASPRTSTNTTLGHSISRRASVRISVPPAQAPAPPKISLQLPSAGNATASPDGYEGYWDNALTPISPAGSSVIYGSDVIRRTVQRTGSQSTPGRNGPFLQRTLSTTTASSRMPGAPDDLSVVAESMLEPSDSSPIRFRPTFGEDAFLTAGVLPRRSPSSDKQDVDTHSTWSAAST